MPRTDEEARQELTRMLKERDLTPAQLARRIRKDSGFVWRKLNTGVVISVTDYNLMKEALEAVSPVVLLEQPPVDEEDAA